MATQTMKTISPKDLADLKQQGGSINLIDVRTPVEFREVHVDFARNVPLDQLNSSDLRDGHQQDEPLYVICRSGSRAAKACDAIVESGFTNVVNVEGGTQAWDEAGFPVVRDKKIPRLPTIRGVVPDLLHLPDGCRFADRCDKVHTRCHQAVPELHGSANGSESHKVACFSPNGDA